MAAMIPRRSWNICEGFIGVPGSGKSTLAVHRCMELHLRDGAHVFIHDSGWNVPERLPMELGGGNCGILRHADFESCTARIARDGRGLHAFHKQSASEVIEYARKVARASLQAGGGNAGSPVVVYIDEVVLASDMTPHKLSEDIKSALTQRRHDHVGFLWATQLPNQIHPQCLSLSTKVFLFRCPGTYAAKRFREAAIPEELIDEVATLPNHEHVEYLIGSAYEGDSDADEIEDDADSSENEKASESPSPSIESEEINQSPAIAPPIDAQKI